MRESQPYSDRHIFSDYEIRDEIIATASFDAASQHPLATAVACLAASAEPNDEQLSAGSVQLFEELLGAERRLCVSLVTVDRPMRAATMIWLTLLRTLS